MTDNEIIKALELCSADECWCDDCPYENLCTDTDITKFALDLINRQKSEIERLQKLLDDKCDRCIAKDKAEAVKEFAERLKGYYIKVKGYDRPYAHTMISFLLDKIDNLVKEMVGDDK